MLKVRKMAKTRLWLWVHISWTWTAKASKFCVILRIDLNKSFPKFGILNSFHSEILKARKSIKNDFKWRLHISRSTAVKATKFYVILKLDLNNSFPRFGILTIPRNTNCRLLKKVLKWLYFNKLRSYMTETYTIFTLVSLLPWYPVSCF